MDRQIPVGTLRGGLLTILEETFEQVHGDVLDPGDSFFETLAGISADEASRPISARCASLSAQVNHVRFSIDAMMEAAAGGGPQQVDWESSWQVGAVSDDEWRDLSDRLRVSYGQVQAFARTFEDWDERFVGGAFALVGHCAYHLGQIRQSLCVLKGA